MSKVAKGKDKVGTTGKGIGPTYTDKVSRNGLRVGDILSDFENKYAAHKERHMKMLAALGWTDFEGFEETEKLWMEGIDYMKEFKFVDSEIEVNHLLRENKHILCEGAQGTMLDVDFGSYPFVTSSNTICAGACTGLGIGPNKVGNVYGIMKAYCTRVGSGPFPTELFDETGDLLGEVGHEYGVTTGRKRRCGWYDAVVVNYAARINGLTDLAITKLDVLGCLDEIKVCVAYECDGKIYKTVPEHQSVFYHAKPVYETLPGWKCDISNVRNFYQLPREAKDYIDFLEQLAGVRVSIITVGPDREQTIDRYWR